MLRPDSALTPLNPEPARATPTDRLLGFKGGISQTVKFFTQADGMLVAMVIWLSVSALSALAISEPFDLALYNWFSRIQVVAPPPPKVLLVAIPQTESTHELDWPILCQRLIGAGILRIAITVPLSDTAADRLIQSGCAPQLVAGVWVPEDAAGLEKAAARAAALSRRGIAVGASRIADQGQLIRERENSYALGDIRYPALEVLSAEGIKPVIGGRFTPDLRPSPERLPMLALQRIMSEGVIPELTKGKIAVIGFAADPLLQSVNIPGHSRAMSLLHYEGLVIDAIAGRQKINSPEPAMRIGMLAVITLLIVFVLQPLALRAGIILLITATLGEIALSGTLLGLLATWPPLTELLILQLGIFFGVYRIKAIREGRQLREILSTTSGKLQRRTRPANILQTNEHWAFIARLVDQTLHLHRTIFLERIPDDHRVREIIALRCGVSDIGEMRRDYERTPYTTAITARGVIEVKRYLSNVSVSERQFLAPLAFGGEVMGFWAFGIEEQHLALIPDLDRAVNEIAGQVANLLYQRKIWQAQAAKAEHSWDRLFEDGNVAAYRELNQSVLLMEQRLASLEQIFGTQTNAAILYDVFGRVVLLNPSMTALLTTGGVAPYQLTVTDFVARMTGQSINDIRSLIRHLVIERQPISLPASLAEYPDRKFTLKAQALRHADDEATEAGPPSPFNLTGILVELLDVSEAHKLVEMKSDLVTQVGYKLSNNVESLLLAAHVLQDDDLPADERKLVANMIQNSAEEVSTVVRHVRTLLAADIGTQQTLHYPIDPIRILQRVRQELGPELEKNRLSFTFSLPNFQTLVIADPYKLATTVSAIVRFLASDAVTGSSLMLRIEEEGLHLRFLFTNEGFGIPAARLQESLASTDESDASDIFRGLRQACQTVASWNGKLDLSSTVGGGTEALLVLNTFWEQPMNGAADDHQQIG